MRIIGIDYGSKRVGVASTDESGSFALPRAVWANDAELIEKILKLKEEEGAEKVVLGESKNLDNIPNSIQEEIAKFKNSLEERGIEVILHPEVYTSKEARHLQGENEMHDASAAALILKSYLDSKL